MAAAEYYSNAPMGPSHQSSPYQRPQYTQTMTNLSQPSQPPPPYQPAQQDHRPTVHFSDTPSRPQRNSFSSHAPIPVLAEERYHDAKPKPYYSPQLQAARPQPQYSQPSYQSHRPQVSFSPQPNSTYPQSYAAGYPSQDYPQRTSDVQRRDSGKPQFLSPHMQPSQTQLATNGYSSDPEPHRRRRRRHSNDNRDSRRQDREAREHRAHKERSRSTNADGFLGAAGGGLIGDLIFPGLGTVGGAVAGWIGGKDYGKHRKNREGRLDRDQEKWEQKHRRQSDERPPFRGDREQRSYERHKHDH